MFLLKNNFFILLSLLAISSTQFVYAANNNAEFQPIDIQSQYLMLDDKKGISVYKGNVLLTQGTLIIKADKITLYSDGEKLTKALIIGTPADVQHEPEDEAKVHSQAKKIEYFVGDERLVLMGQAFVDQGNRHFSGETIEYDTRQRIVTASGGQKNAINSENNAPSGRVHVIIGPEDDESDAEDKE